MKSPLFLIPLLAAALHAQENYADDWSGHTNVIVNTIAAGITNPVVDFPLLVRLDSTHAAVFAEAMADGADLRFTKADDATRLSHEIESWDSAAHAAAIWVLADTIPPARNNYSLRMHWGNPGAADSSNGTAVFDTVNHFQAVWHMAADSADEADVTANGLTAVQNGTPASESAVVGAGRTISDGNYFRADGTASGKLNFPEGSNYTISAWVMTGTLPGHGTIVSKHDNAYALKLNADASSWEFFEFGTDLTAPGWNWVNASAISDLGVWRHLVGVHSEFDVAIFVDGMRQDFGFNTAESTAPRVEDTDVVLGAQPVTNTTVQRAFDGVLDEVRMSDVARDPDWILLEYETQKPGTTVVALMDTVPVPLRPATRTPGAFSVSASGNGLLFRVDAGGAAGARVEVLDMRGLAISSRVLDPRGGTLVWDGRDQGGRLAPQSVYAVRIHLLDGEGGILRTLQRMVPLTR